MHSMCHMLNATLSESNVEPESNLSLFQSQIRQSRRLVPVQFRSCIAHAVISHIKFEPCEMPNNSSLKLREWQDFKLYM